MNGLYIWAIRYSGAIGFVLALFAFAAVVMIPGGIARADSHIEKHEIPFDAVCVRGGEAADYWVTTLIEKWDEIPVFIGSNDGGRIIITRNSHNPTWSMLMETPEGTCMITSGDNHFLNDVDGKEQRIPSGKVEDSGPETSS